MKLSKKFQIAICVCLNIHLLVSAQEKWIIKSTHLPGNDTVLVFKPATYSPKKKYPLVYMLHGGYENYSQWSKIVDLQQLLDKNDFVIICPDGFLSWHIDSPINSHLQLETFFFNDLVPYVHKMIKVDPKNIFVAGLSMGGYGALRYIINHPEYFNAAACSSGGIEITRETLLKASMKFFGTDKVIEDLSGVFGNPLETDWNKYSITTLISQNKSFDKKPILMDCGIQDVLYSSNLNLMHKFEQMEWPLTFISQPGDHNEEYWRRAGKYYFYFFNSHLK